MAQSKYEYVKSFEEVSVALPNCWIVVRIDGRGFHEFTSKHDFLKPVDDRGIGLMNAAASHVMSTYQDIIVAYGQSDEYSFIIHKTSTLFKRRKDKIATTLVSLFTSFYVANWKEFFPFSMTSFPSFDARIICYPSVKNIRDYISWRQVDCHINNLYNYCYWNLVSGNEKSNTLAMTPTAAEKFLSQTVSADKNELLFSKFNINYNSLPELHKKGSVLYWKKERLLVDGKLTPSGDQVFRDKKVVVIDHCDVIGESFWESYSVFYD
ncbi:hypothetical protein RCL1_003730 [Eukaryota sp. TZLM3-RCL]